MPSTGYSVVPVLRDIYLLDTQQPDIVKAPPAEQDCTPAGSTMLGYGGRDLIGGPEEGSPIMRRGGFLRERKTTTLNSPQPTTPAFSLRVYTNKLASNK